jgi:hypothetical protein
MAQIELELPRFKLKLRSLHGSDPVPLLLSMLCDQVHAASMEKPELSRRSKVVCSE